MVYPIAKRTIGPFVRLWLRKVEGETNIPKDKPFIVATNHSSYYDTLLIPSIILSNTNKRMHVWVNNTYWNITFTRLFLNMWEAIPVDIEKQKNAKKKNKAAFNKALTYLKKGRIMIVFPEGKRNVDAKLSRAYTGTAKLALTAKVPVLPIGIIGANKVLPKGAFFPRFRKCEVKIGKPLYFDKYHNKKITKRLLIEITTKIMKEIAKLIGRKYNY